MCEQDLETPLARCLNTFDITTLGVGYMVGAGIYVLTGVAATYRDTRVRDTQAPSSETQRGRQSCSPFSSGVS